MAKQIILPDFEYELLIRLLDDFTVEYVNYYFDADSSIFSGLRKCVNEATHFDDFPIDAATSTRPARSDKPQ